MTTNSTSLLDKGQLLNLALQQGSLPRKFKNLANKVKSEESVKKLRGDIKVGRNCQNLGLLLCLSLSWYLGYNITNDGLTSTVLSIGTWLFLSSAVTGMFGFSEKLTGLTAITDSDYCQTALKIKTNSELATRWLQLVLKEREQILVLDYCVMEALQSAELMIKLKESKEAAIKEACRKLHGLEV